MIQWFGVLLPFLVSLFFLLRGIFNLSSEFQGNVCVCVCLCVCFMCVSVEGRGHQIVLCCNKMVETVSYFLCHQLFFLQTFHQSKCLNQFFFSFFVGDNYISFAEHKNSATKWTASALWLSVLSTITCVLLWQTH